MKMKCKSKGMCFNSDTFECEFCSRNMRLENEPIGDRFESRKQYGGLTFSQYNSKEEIEKRLAEDRKRPDYAEMQKIDVGF